MARMTPLELAQKLALAGDAAGARTAFEDCLGKGEARAAAALAEIAGFEGRWSDVVKLITGVFDDPRGAQTQNVFHDMTSLGGRAAAETGEWLVVAEAARRAERAVSGDVRYVNYAHFADKLASCAESRGIEGLLADLDPPQDVADQKFEFGLEKVARSKRRGATPTERADELYALATVHRSRAHAVRLFDTEGHAIPSRFNSAVFVAASLARVGRADEAWLILRSALPVWWPVEETQVAPIALLVDPALAALMTPERCVEILRTPRGPEAAAE